MKQCGIYIIKNKINDKVYVGQSVDIMVRWYAHKQAAKSFTRDGRTKIHTAMRELGIDNFYLEILELCDYSKLSEREIYWIDYYDSYNNGYNMTKGGEANIGETNGRALLTEDMVRDIRSAYNSKIPFREVYEKYKNVISKRGLRKVWICETWKYIMPEVYTDENRKWHTTQAKAHADGNKSLGVNNAARACSEEEIAKMRELRAQGTSYMKIAEQLHRSAGVVRKYCLFQECTNKNKTSGVKVKNVETGLVFDTLVEAATWAKCGSKAISANKNTNKSAGIVVTTGEPAHWVTL